jgi:hypothetical protein
MNVARSGGGARFIEQSFNICPPAGVRFGNAQLLFGEVKADIFATNYTV